MTGAVWEEGRLPSPLEVLRDERLGTVRVLLKRDDLIHPEIAGNKWRKLRRCRWCGGACSISISPAPTGRCRGCGSQVTAAPWWPCTLYTAAARARRIAAARR